MDQELADAGAYAPARRCVCTRQMAALFCVKWRRGRHLESLTTSKKSSRQSMRKNIPAKFYPDPIWNDGVLGLGFFEEVAPTREEER